MNRSTPWLAVASAFLIMSSAPAQDDAVEAERELGEVRARIEQLQEKLSETDALRSSAQQALREAELAEARTRKQLAAISRDLKAARRRLGELNVRVAQRRTELDGYADALADQLRLAYMTGQEEWLRVMLNREDPVEVSRQLVYYSYIARQRTDLMAEVRIKIESLRAAVADVAAEEVRLEGLESKQQPRLAELSAARKERSIALARIDEDIADRSDRLTALQEEARSLETLVADLTRLLTSLPAGDAVPFADRKGNMAWPVQGRKIGSFGRPRADGQLRWEGVMLSAGAGTDVRAVHHGRVVFADWLPGMGLLIVLEHGDGYMSLYGHNQDLLRDVGEWVSPDTVIARVGDSGGRADPGLYFEIRKDGSPVDPADWIDK